MRSTECRNSSPCAPPRLAPQGGQGAGAQRLRGGREKFGMINSEFGQFAGSCTVSGGSSKPLPYTQKHRFTTVGDGLAPPENIGPCTMSAGAASCSPTRRNAGSRRRGRRPRRPACRSRYHVRGPSGRPAPTRGTRVRAVGEGLALPEMVDPAPCPRRDTKK